MSNIPLIDLRPQYRALKPEIDAAIQRVLERGQFILGPEVEALEREVASYCGTRYAVGVASGTDALELSLRACGIGPGDEVITSAYSFFATPEAIIAVGAAPAFVDIEPATYTLDPAEVAAKMTLRTKAIIPIHLYGHPCAMDRIMEIARAHRVTVIEDCAQAIGAAFRGRRVGSFGDAGCLSFYPSKNLGGYGDGGMVVTNSPSVAERIRLLRNHGSRERYRHVALGTNSRLDELQAAVLRVKLRHLNRWNEARRRNARRYADAFRRCRIGGIIPRPNTVSRSDTARPNGRAIAFGDALGRGIILPREQPGCRHVYHLYAIRTRRRSRVCAALTRAGIDAQVAYPSTLPAQPALRPYVRGAGRFPIAEAVSREILALPMYPELTPSQIERVVAAVAQALADL